MNTDEATCGSTLPKPTTNGPWPQIQVRSLRFLIAVRVVLKVLIRRDLTAFESINLIRCCKVSNGF